MLCYLVCGDAFSEKAGKGRWRMETFFPFPVVEITFLSSRAKHRLLISDFVCSHLHSIHGFYP